MDSGAVTDDRCAAEDDADAEGAAAAGEAWCAVADAEPGINSIRARFDTGMMSAVAELEEEVAAEVTEAAAAAAAAWWMGRMPAAAAAAAACWCCAMASK